VADRSGPGGFLPLAWGPAEVELSMRLWDSQWPSRPSLAALYRELGQRAGGEVLAGTALRAALGGDGPHPRSPEVAGRHLRVLLDLALLRPEGDVSTGSVASGGFRVVSSEGTDLTRSQAFVAYRARHEEGRRYLSRRRHPE
jgi:hypothetical protein